MQDFATRNSSGIIQPGFQKIGTGIFPVLALLIGALLNYGLDEQKIWHYDWLLQPIVFLLENSQGLTYSSSVHGYAMPESNIVVAPNCAGLRFLALCLLGGSLLLKGKRWQTQLFYFLSLLPLVYCLTILASFSRIVIWMKLLTTQHSESVLKFFTLPDDIITHAAIGLLVYLMFFIIAGLLWPRFQRG